MFFKITKHEKNMDSYIWVAALEFDILSMKIKDIRIYDLVIQSHIILGHKL